MKRILLAGALLAPLSVPSVAYASTPTRQHVREYVSMYSKVRRMFGPHAVGCNLVSRRGSCHLHATDGMVIKSLAVLTRDLIPETVTRTTTTQSAVVVAGGAVARSTPMTYEAPSSGLASCIIQHESGGNPEAVNGQYEGIGQWSPNAWAQYGGTKYASSPTGASYSQQVAVLNSEGTAGMEDQQGQYDGCS